MPQDLNSPLITSALRFSKETATMTRQRCGGLTRSWHSTSESFRRGGHLPGLAWGWRCWAVTCQVGTQAPICTSKVHEKKTRTIRRYIYAARTPMCIPFQRFELIILLYRRYRSMSGQGLTCLGHGTYSSQLCSCTALCWLPVRLITHGSCLSAGFGTVC